MGTSPAGPPCPPDRGLARHTSPASPHHAPARERDRGLMRGTIPASRPDAPAMERDRMLACGTRPGVTKQSTCQGRDRGLMRRSTPASPNDAPTMERDRVLMRGTSPASPKKHRAWTGSRPDARYQPSVATKRPCHGTGSHSGVRYQPSVATRRTCQGRGSRPARRTSHRGACGTDAPVREREAEQPRGADQRDRGDFVDWDAREGVPDRFMWSSRWQLTGTVRWLSHT